MKAAFHPNPQARTPSASHTSDGGLVRPAVIAAMLALAGITSAQAQGVTYFDKPPSAAELRRALLGGSSPQTVAPVQSAPAPARPSGVRTRGIVWSSGGQTPVQNVAPAPARQSAIAPSSAPVYADPVQQANSYQQKQDFAESGPAAGMPINFAIGSSRLAGNSIGFIQTVAEMLNADPSIRLVIEGHTDSLGSYKRNMVLSWERAMGVYRVLVEQYGIDPARLRPSGKGPTEPMPGTAPTDGSNRRVQFRLMG